MKVKILFVIQTVIINQVWSMPMFQNGNGISSFMSNKPGLSNIPTMNAFTNMPGNTFGNMNFVPNSLASSAIIASEPMFNTNFIPNNFAKGNAILANEAISNANMLASANPVLANELIGNAVISNANFIPLANMPSGFANNFPMSPIISEIVPSLQYGDVTMTGDLPIGGTIKVCGCFPVYGMITVDGAVPSSGTAVVGDFFGNQLSDVITKCANQVIL